MPAVSQPLNLLYVDEHLLVAEKPAGLLAVPGRGEAGLDNLASRVQAVHPQAQVVHRLDMATSGLMLMALGPEMQRRLNFAFAQRQVDKAYVAVVEGEMAGDSGEIAAPLAADWPNRPRQKVDFEMGKASLTRWRVLTRATGCTRLALMPISGRTHQLRVHLQHIGHPIRGDVFYAPAPLNSPRLLLHATDLQLLHPATGQALHFRSEAAF
jgi:tRNA pseudouridine32 synthase/23S rRNA pseudouridine746 synthase